MRDGLFDRDYSQEFSITLEWGEWNRLFSLMVKGIGQKSEEDWPGDEYERDKRLRKKFVQRLGDNDPGNGIDDWPDSMKKAYDEAAQDMLEDMRNE